MSTHYLVDAFIANPLVAAILDVREAPQGQSPVAGTFVIRVADYLAVQKPTDVTDLLTKKHLAMLAFYAGFTRIVFDDLLDTTSVDLTDPLTRGSFGDRGTMSLSASFGYMASTMIGLTGPAPAQAFLTWETYSFLDADANDASSSRTYNEVSSDSSNITCEVSFDNGVSWFTTTDQTILNIPVLSRGLDFKVRFSNVSGTRLSLGSWALVY